MFYFFFLFFFFFFFNDTATTEIYTLSLHDALPVEPDPHHSAVQDQADDRFLDERAGIPAIPIGFHLPPHPAHRVLTDRPAEHGCERPPHPTRVGPGKVAARDQRIRMLGSPLVGPQRLALPLRCLALRGVEP